MKALCKSKREKLHIFQQKMDEIEEFMILILTKLLA